MDHGGKIEGFCSLAFVKEFEEPVSKDRDFDDDFFALVLICVSDVTAAKSCSQNGRYRNSYAMLQCFGVFEVIFVFQRKVLNNYLLSYLSKSSISTPLATAIVGCCFRKRGNVKTK